MSSKSKDDKSPGEQLLELVLIVVVAIGLALGIQAFLVKPYRIPSPSMVPTLREGQRVLVNRIGNTFNDPKVGDIYVFHPPALAEERQGEGQGPESDCGTSPPRGAPCSQPGSDESAQNFIKRVVAGPGDTIAVRNGRVIRNGKLIKESYANLSLCFQKVGGRVVVSEGCNFPTPIKVPPDHWFMMGDNRGNSLDSRFWGPVPKKWIIGQAFATYWPPGRLGLL